MTYTEITAVKGVRNDISADRFASGDLAYARNIDLDESGRAMRRKGTSVVFAGAAHSAWGGAGQGFYVQGGSLRRFLADGTTAALCEVAGARVCYAEINGEVFWSDGLTAGIVVHGANRSWGITPPAAVVPAPGAGALPAGTYLCTMAFVDQDGKESGAPRAGALTLGTDGALVFAGLPVSANPRVVSKNLYVSAPNGDLPLLTAVLANAATSLTISALPAQGVPVRTMFMGPPPAGQVLGHYNGRAYVASGQFLFYSQPFEHELFDQRSGFIVFDSAVQTFAAVGDGIFVGTESRTVFLAGANPEEFVLRAVAPHGAVLGTEQKVGADVLAPTEDGGGATGDIALWMSRRGLVVGMDGGATQSLTAKHFAIPSVTSGGAILKRRDGTPQYLVSLAS